MSLTHLRKSAFVALFVLVALLISSLWLRGNAAALKTTSIISKANLQKSQQTAPSGSSQAKAEIFANYAPATLMLRSAEDSAQWHSLDGVSEQYSSKPSESVTDWPFPTLSLQAPGSGCTPGDERDCTVGCKKGSQKCQSPDSICTPYLKPTGALTCGYDCICMLADPPTVYGSPPSVPATKYPDYGEWGPCEPLPYGEETCDGEDNDGDCQVDEEVEGCIPGDQCGQLTDAPVNLATGILYLDPVTDFTLSSPAGDLEFVRRYSTSLAQLHASTAPNILGMGWTHPWSDVFQWNGPAGESDAAWLTNAGEHLTFQYNSADKNWRPPLDHKEKLSYSDGIVTISLSSGEKRIFDSSQRFRNIITPNGMVTTITYHDESGCPAANGSEEICTVRLADGQAIRFNYETLQSGQITTPYVLTSISYGIDPPTSEMLKLVAFNYSTGWPGWISAYGLPPNGTYGGFDEIRSISPTMDGGYIMAGVRQGTADYLDREREMWVVKLDGEGLVEWEKIYGGREWRWDGGSAIQPTTDGGYIVAGYTYTYAVSAGSTASPTSDFWVVKLAIDGTMKWQKAYGGIGMEQANSVYPTADGGYLVSGWTKSFGAGNADAWILKLAPNGNPQWSKTYGGAESDVISNIAPASDGGYIVAGSTNSFERGEDVWVMKLNTLGEVQWQKSYGGAAADVANSIQTTTDGGYIVAGWTESFGDGAKDAWVIKLDPDGAIQWQNAYGGARVDAARTITATSDGGYIVAGSTNSFERGEDVWVMKLNTLGEVQWQKSYGGAAADVANSIRTTSDGGYIVAGWTESFGVGSSRDAWVLKLDAEGNAGQSCQVIQTPEVDWTETPAVPLNTSIDISSPGFTTATTKGETKFEFLNTAYQCIGSTPRSDRYYLVGTYYPQAAVDGSDLGGFSYTYRVPAGNPYVMNGRVTINHQDPAGVVFVEQVLDPDGRLVERHEYGSDGRVVQSETTGSSIKIAYGSSSGPDAGPATVVDTLNTTVQISRFKDGRVYHVSLGACPFCGNEYTYAITPDRSRDQTCEQDRYGTLTYYEYDAYHRLTKEVRNAADCSGTLRADGTSVTIAYIPHPNPDLDLVSSRIEPGNLDSTQTRFTQYQYRDDTALIDAIVRSGRTYTDLSGTIGVITYTTTFSYDSMGRLLEAKGPRPEAPDGADDKIGYDYYDDTAAPFDRGRVWHTKRGWNGTEYTEITTYADYTLFGQATRITDPNGVTTILEYDQKGRLTKHMLPSENGLATTEYAYTPGGELDYVQLPKGNYINYTYDSNGLLARVDRQADLNGVTFDSIVYVRDDRNLVETEIHYQGTTEVQRVAYGYNSQRLREKATVMASPRTAQGTTYYLYDGGRLWKVGEPLRQPNANPGPITSSNWNGTWNVENIYDALGRLEEIKRLIGESDATWQSVASYGYDAGNNLTDITVQGITTNYLYDDFDRLVQVTSPDAGTTVYVYDEAGNLTQQKNPDGKVIQYTYDQQDRLTRVEFPSSGTEPWALDYGESIALNVNGANSTLANTVGRLSSVRQGRLETYYSYTRDGRISAEYRADTTASAGEYRATRYTYDLNGNISTILYPVSGQQVLYVYNELDVDRVSQVVLVKDRNVTLISDISYDKDGRPLSWTAGDMEWITTQLQGRGIGEMKLVREGEVFLDWRGTDFNMAGYVEQWEDLIAREKTVEYQYEMDFGRIHGEARSASIGGTVTQPDVPYSDSTWRYDLAGNRIDGTRNGAPTVYNYYPETNRLQNDAFGVQFAYTPGGQVSSLDDVVSFTYDEMGRLVVSEERRGTDLAGGTPSQTNLFIYDFNGHRIENRTGASGQTDASTYYWYSQGGELLEIMEPASGTELLHSSVWDYIYLNGQLIAVIEGDLEVESPVYREKTTYYVFPGHLGQPLAAVSAEHQTLAWKAEYSAYGEVVADLYDVKSELRTRSNQMRYRPEDWMWERYERFPYPLDIQPNKQQDTSICPVTDDFPSLSSFCLTLNVGTYTFAGAESVRVHVKNLVLSNDDYLSVQTADGIEVQRIRSMTDLENGWTVSVPGSEARLRVLTLPTKEAGYAAVSTDAVARVLGQLERQDFESPHPYPNANCSGPECGKVWSVTYDNKDAIQGRVCFLQIGMSLPEDTVRIKDESGRTLLEQRIIMRPHQRSVINTLLEQGAFFDNRCTSWFATNTLTVEIVTDNVRIGNQYGVRGYVEWHMPPPNIPQRYPGQEEDSIAGRTIYHNWYRWYDPSTGRYLQADPLIFKKLMSQLPADLLPGDRSLVGYQWVPTLCSIDVGRSETVDVTYARSANSSKYSPLIGSSYIYVDDNPVSLIDPTGLVPCYQICWGDASTTGQTCKLAGDNCPTPRRKTVPDKVKRCVGGFWRLLEETFGPDDKSKSWDKPSGPGMGGARG